jgi:hypothetical protein
MVTHSPPAPVCDVGTPNTRLPDDLGGCEAEWMDSFLPAYRVHWCGHGQEVLPILAKDGKCDLVPVIGEAC